MQEKKRRPWSPEARQRHLEGCRRYQEGRKVFELLMKFQAISGKYEISVHDLVDLFIRRGEDKEFREEILALNTFEERKSFLQDAIQEL
jgi:hypothetical protein